MPHRPAECSAKTNQTLSFFSLHVNLNASFATLLLGWMVDYSSCCRLYDAPQSHPRFSRPAFFRRLGDAYSPICRFCFYIAGNHDVLWFQDHSKVSRRKIFRKRYRVPHRSAVGSVIFNMLLLFNDNRFKFINLQRDIANPPIPVKT